MYFQLSLMHAGPHLATVQHLVFVAKYLHNFRNKYELTKKILRKFTCLAGVRSISIQDRDRSSTTPLIAFCVHADIINIPLDIPLVSFVCLHSYLRNISPQIFHLVSKITSTKIFFGKYPTVQGYFITFTTLKRIASL